MLAWAAQHSRVFPWRSEKRTPYTILLAEILLRRTTSTAVAKSYERILSKYPSIKSLASTSIRELDAAFGMLGLQRQRAIAAQRLAKVVVNRFSGVIPSNREQLVSIPSIGPYTAGAILSFGFGISAPVVDSNIERVIRRVFSISVGYLPPAQVSKAAVLLVPMCLHEAYNWGLIDLGAIC